METMDNMIETVEQIDKPVAEAAAKELASLEWKALPTEPAKKGVNGFAIATGVSGAIALGLGIYTLWDKLIKPARAKKKDRKAEKAAKKEKKAKKKTPREEEPDDVDEDDQLDMETIDQDMELDDDEE